jgi:hypothetical protein
MSRFKSYIHPTLITNNKDEQEDQVLSCHSIQLSSPRHITQVKQMIFTSMNLFCFVSLVRLISNIDMKRLRLDLQLIVIDRQYHRHDIPW